MPEFLTPLRVQLIDEVDRANSAGGDGVRSSWILLTPLHFKSDVLGRLYVVPQGFLTDFASTPSGMQQKAFKASVLHDHAYRSKDLSKDDADAMFLEAMTVDNIPGREMMYAAVRAFGKNSYDPNAPSAW